jgi:serine/threonine protein kinase
MSNIKSRERGGVLLERTVGSLNEALKADHIFLTDMTIISKPHVTSSFEWQITYHHGDKQSDRDKRRLFSDLCICTCQRLIADLRVIGSLYHHFHHLAHCVRYIHENGVVHGDIKPNNIFVRATDCTADCVNRVQLVLADFDSSCNYNRDISRHQGSFERRSPLGTPGYHPADYSPIVPYST